MTKTLTGLFDSYNDAEAAVRDLEASGIRHDQISIVANNSQRQMVPVGSDSDAGKAAAASATAGALVGGGAGLLASLGLLAIPGVGPVIAAGWLAATLAGAAGGVAVVGAGGGLVGAMIHSDVPEADAHLYAEGVRRGGTLVIARVDESMATLTESILQRNRLVDTQQRAQMYRETGWDRFDPNAPAMTSEEIARHRQMDPSGTI
jgi:hypothetical protein